MNAFAAACRKAALKLRTSTNPSSETPSASVTCRACARVKPSQRARRARRASEALTRPAAYAAV